MIDGSTASPKISVLMTAYNGETYLREAIDSILAQTFPDYEVLIVDDGSTDSSPSIVRSYDDPRITLLQMPHGGLPRALNAGLEKARGTFIARMDADDRMHPERFARQIAYFETHPETDFLCTDVIIIDARGRSFGRQSVTGLTNDTLRESLLFRRAAKPLIHPSVMMRRSAVASLGGYRELSSAQDHDLWLRAIDRFTFRRLNEPLLEYRFHGGSISSSKMEAQAANSAMCAVDYLVHKQTGRSLLAADEPLGPRYHARMREALAREVLPAARSFRDAKGHIISGRRMTGLMRLMLGGLRHGPAILPRDAQRRTRAVVDRLAREALAEMAGATAAKR